MQALITDAELLELPQLPFFDPWMREPGRGHRGTNLLFKRFASDRMNGASEERIPLEIAIPRPVILVVLALLMPY